MNEKVEGSVNQPGTGKTSMHTPIPGIPTSLLAFDDGGLRLRVR